jgi:N-acetylglutamate synthase-like GNAT family acetyltransferase
MIQIRLYASADRERCIEVFKSNCPLFFANEELFDFEQWLNLFEERPSTYTRLSEAFNFVITDNSFIVGCGGFYYTPDRQHARMTWGMIARNLHRNGYGRQFFEYRFNKAAELLPGVKQALDTTQHSFGFFEKLGFKIDQITPDAYAPGLHRYDMSLR